MAKSPSTTAAGATKSTKPRGRSKAGLDSRAVTTLSALVATAIASGRKSDDVQNDDLAHLFDVQRVLSTMGGEQPAAQAS